MLEDRSNRELLAAWQNGNDAAASLLVRRFMARLTALARARLAKKLARRIDPEDVVMSAWRSFFVAADRQQIHVPDDDNLWPLLVTVTLRKLARQSAHHSAAKRAVDFERQSLDEATWPEIAARDPTPAEAAQVVDDLEQLMSQLPEKDRVILEGRLQGEGPASIAASAGCTERTVRRSLQRVRETYLKLHGESLSELHEDSGFGLLSDNGVPNTPTSKDAAPQATRSTVSAESPSQFPATFDFSDVVLQRLVGQGAFGRVYQACLTADQTTVAVKFLRKRFWRDSLASEQLLREAAIVSRLTHQGIVRHFGWGCSPQNAVFAVMEWIDGDDLTVWHQQSHPTLADVIRCGLDICDSVGAVHDSGIVHGDLTPRNVIRRRDGSFVVTDFGFGRSVGEQGVEVSAGTPGFLAPEQLCDAFGSASPRTDIYGIGGLLFFLLSGRPPVAGPSIADSMAATLSLTRVESVNTINKTVPPLLDELISACLAKEPSDRPQSVLEVRSCLKHSLQVAVERDASR
jgi:RNA polymerase sigma factor (sigma-70 family)